MLRIFLALWLALTPAFAWAGSMSLLGVGTVNAAIPGPPTFTFQNASVFTTSSGADVTFTSSLSAPASANRFVAVMVGQPDSGVGYTVNSATFAPMPSAITTMAMIENPGVRRRVRRL